VTATSAKDTGNLKNTFTGIYKTNLWNSRESHSGTGSDLSQTRVLIKNLERLFEEYNIKSVLDIPCGDLNWMRTVNLTDIKYTGADIVMDLIYKNKERFKHLSNMNFKLLDLTSDPLPEVDLILCRDCLVHLSYENIFKALSNIQSSNCKYLLTTTFTDREINYEIRT